MEKYLDQVFVFHDIDDQKTQDRIRSIVATKSGAVRLHRFLKISGGDTSEDSLRRFLASEAMHRRAKRQREEAFHQDLIAQEEKRARRRMADRGICPDCGERGIELEFTRLPAGNGGRKAMDALISRCMAGCGYFKKS